MLGECWIQGRRQTWLVGAELIFWIRGAVRLEEVGVWVAGMKANGSLYRDSQYCVPCSRRRFGLESFGSYSGA